MDLKVLTCVLMYVSAAPVCRKRIEFREVGLCSSNGTVTRWKCPSCQPGYGQSVECGRMYPEGTKVGCVPCKGGQAYSDSYDIGQCKLCTKCQENEVIESGQCKPEKDTTKCTCKAGYYRDTWARDCKPCSWCCKDGSNKNITECNIPQVPLGKQCSLQTKKSCAPITPTPMATSITSDVTSTSTTAEKSTSTSSTVTKITTTRKRSNNKTKEFVRNIVLSIAFIPIIISCMALTRYFWILKRKGSANRYACRRLARLDGNRNSARPLLPGPHREVHSNGSGAHVVLDPRTATGAYHIGCEGLNETVCKQMTSLDEQKINFICTKLGPGIVNLKHEQMQILCSMLNVPINGKDYKNLDAFCNLDYYENRGQENSSNPMQNIIDAMISQSKTLKSFLEELYRISRGDVVEKLYDVAKTK